MVSGIKEGTRSLGIAGQSKNLAAGPCHTASGVEAAIGGKQYGDMLGRNALVKGQDFSSLRLQAGTARILRSEIGSEGSELFQLR